MEYKLDPNKPAVKKKKEQVKASIEEMKKYKTVAMLELSKLPDALLQSLRNKLKEDGGKVLVLRKAVVTRVLEANPKLKDKISECEKPVALILTNQSPYELHRFFKQHKKKRAAKVGDVAMADIVIPEGETDLPPGPALSELKAGGVNVQIKGGKIVVARDSTIAKAGEKITVPKVKALQSLGVMPFEVMANLIFGYDGTYSFTRELLGMGDTINEDMASCLSQGFNLSMNASYPTEQNIEVLLGEAVRQSVNVALNSDTYSSESIEQLLSSAMRQGGSLEGLMPAEAPKEEPTNLTEEKNGQGGSLSEKTDKSEAEPEKAPEQDSGVDAPAEKPAEEKKE
jgi:large subunit ribosomal protein L10